MVPQKYIVPLLSVSQRTNCFLKIHSDTSGKGGDKNTKSEFYTLHVLASTNYLFTMDVVVVVYLTRLRNLVLASMLVHLVQCDVSNDF